MSLLRALMTPLLLINQPPEVLQRLLMRLFREQEEEAPKQVRLLLGYAESWGLESLPVLLRALHHRDWEVRSAAILALWRLQAVEVVPILEAAFFQEEDEVLRGEILQALAGLLEALPLVQVRGRLVGMMLHALEDAQWEVRLQAVYALGRMQDEGVLEALLEALERESDDEVRAALVLCLGKRRDRRATAPLLAMLEHELEVDVGLALELIVALGRLGDSRAFSVLVDALDDVEPSLSGRAAWALGHLQLELEESRVALREQLEAFIARQPAPGAVAQAAVSLVRLGVERADAFAMMSQASAFWAAQIRACVGDDPFAPEVQDTLLPGVEEVPLALAELTFVLDWLSAQTLALWTRRGPQERAQIEALQGLLPDIAQAISQVDEKNGALLASAQAALQRLERACQQERLERWQQTYEEALFED